MLIGICTDHITLFLGKFLDQFTPRRLVLERGPRDQFVIKIAGLSIFNGKLGDIKILLADLTLDFQAEIRHLAFIAFLRRVERFVGSCELLQLDLIGLLVFVHMLNAGHRAIGRVH